MTSPEMLSKVTCERAFKRQNSVSQKPDNYQSKRAKTNEDIEDIFADLVPEISNINLNSLYSTEVNIFQSPSL